MIVPLIELSSSFSWKEQTSLFDQVEKFGVLGRVAFHIADGADMQSLDYCVAALGGAYDIQLLFESFDEVMALNLLNAGANQVLVPQALVDSAIPSDRWKLVGDRSSELDVARIGELWQEGEDCLVDVEVLKTPSVLAEILGSVLKSDRPRWLVADCNCRSAWYCDWPRVFEFRKPQDGDRTEGRRLLFPIAI